MGIAIRSGSPLSLNLGKYSDKISKVTIFGLDYKKEKLEKKSSMKYEFDFFNKMI